MSCQKCGGEHSAMACDDADEQPKPKAQSSFAAPACSATGTMTSERESLEPWILESVKAALDKSGSQQRFVSWLPRWKIHRETMDGKIRWTIYRHWLWMSYFHEECDTEETAKQRLKEIAYE